MQSEAPHGSTPLRFANATLAIWDETGSAGISIRALARRAGAPTSSLYHHFGTLEHLYLFALDHAARSVHEWTEARLAQMPNVGGLTASALPAILAATIDDWTRDCRRFAIAWYECHLLAARDTRYLPALRTFNSIWRTFWEAVSARLGASHAGEVTSLFFIGETRLHLMRWNRLIDRAALDEACHGWARWLEGQSSGKGVWRRAASRTAVRAAVEFGASSETAERIADAAADVIEESGMIALTHRAVAAKAGLTLGIVSHNFKSSSDLARAAFEAIYRRTTPLHPYKPHGPRVSRQEAWTLLCALGNRDRSGDFAMHELMLAAARDPALAEFVPQLRYVRDKTAHEFLDALLGERSDADLDAAIFVSFVGGQLQASLGLPAAEGEAFFERTIRALPLFRSTGPD